MDISLLNYGGGLPGVASTPEPRRLNHPHNPPQVITFATAFLYAVLRYQFPSQTQQK